MPAHARVSYQVVYPDPLGRIVATADYGTNGGSPLTRQDTIPDRSLDIRVSSTEYNDAGQAFRTTDPGGRVDEKTFDAAGRLTKTVENVVVNGTDDDENRTTDFTYNLEGKMTTLAARNHVTGDQVTQWAYGVDVDTSGVARNDLLRQKIYPDSSSSSDSVQYAYNRQGELIQQTDQAATVHAFLYDKLGRLLHDCVSLPTGSAIDNAVLRISRTYNSRGLLASVTSWDNATVGSGNIVNEVTRTYNAFGQLLEEKQSHSAAVGEGTPAVGYDYEQDQTTPTPNTIRPVSLSYPNGRLLHFGYGEPDEMSDVLSRVEELSDTQSLVAYAYLGTGQVVQVAYPEPGVNLTYLKQAGDPTFEDGDPRDPGDQYAGLDRFGRIQDQRWLKCESSSSSAAALERVQFTYNQAGNMVTRHNLVAPSGQDEVYEYDGLYQLRNFQRGTLELESDILHLASPPDWTEDFTYDPLGNWQRYQTDDGVNPLDQHRTHNPVNEITGISYGSSSSSASASTLGYDPAGNMTRCPTPSSFASTGGAEAVFDLTWDAWNRLVKVEDGETVVAEYGYDGLTRRITKAVEETVRHYYYNAQWQVLEERLNDNDGASRQWLWGLLRLDDPVLRDEISGGDFGMRYYALGDHLSVRTLVSGSGVVERFAYSAFGQTTVLNPDWTPASNNTSACGWEIRLHGYRWDEETGLYQVRYRYLHAGLGRWVSRDRLGEVFDLHLYKSMHNRPVTLFDSTGLCTLGERTIGNVEVKVTPAGQTPEDVELPEKFTKAVDWIDRVGKIVEGLIAQGVDTASEGFKEAIENALEQQGAPAFPDMLAVYIAAIRQAQGAFNGWNLYTRVHYKECVCKSFLFWSRNGWTDKTSEWRPCSINTIAISSSDEYNRYVYQYYQDAMSNAAACRDSHIEEVKNATTNDK